MADDFLSFFAETKHEAVFAKLKFFLTGNSIDSIDTNGRTLLIASIDSGEDFALVTKFLVESGANVNGTRKSGYYPLEAAILAENIKAFDILTRCQRLKYKRKSDHSLSFAAYIGHPAITKHLITKGYDLNQKYRGMTPIHWATQERHLEIVKILCSCGADVNSMDDESGMTPLYSAAGNGAVEIVKLLLSYSADANQKSFSGTSPLQIASAWGHYDVISVLLDSGADIDSSDNESRTALFYAMIRDYTKMCDFLLSKGASFDVVDTSGISISQLKDESVRQKLYEEHFGGED